MKDQWNKIKQKISGMVNRPHLPWKEWELIFAYLKKKECFPEKSAWWEYETGLDKETQQLGTTQTWGMAAGLSVSKVALKLKNNVLTVYKNRNELASCEVALADLQKF